MATLPKLYGRAAEVRVLDDLIERVREHGGAVVVRGDAGIGKSTLLEAACARAGTDGMLVLRTTGVQTEAHLPFAGLHQLLQPLLADVDDLPTPQRAALEAAFGIADTAAPDPFLIALATLDLLCEAASRAPILLVADDAHWLDLPTVAALTFVARRVAHEPIILAVAIHEGFENPFGGGGLPELLLEGLDGDDAGALLDAHASDLAPGLRARLLREAAGNPLALAELPAALDEATVVPDRLPLTERLEHSFGARLAELPEDTRTLLRVAAFDDSGVVEEVLAAGKTLAKEPLTAHALAPAVSARLVDVDETTIRFRHPLVRSAICQTASTQERHDVHSALATALAHQPDRAVWHRAAARTTPDEEVAADLEAAATRAHARGGVAVAAAALERAVALTDDPTLRAGRLFRAAALEFELGRHEALLSLLRQGERMQLSRVDEARLALIREMAEEPSILGKPESLRSLVEHAERACEAGASDLAVELLWAAASICFWADPGPETRMAVVEAAERAGDIDSDPRIVGILAFAAPVERGSSVIAQLSRYTPGERDARRARVLGGAAHAVGEFELAAAFFATSISTLRAEGRLGLLARALVLQSRAALYLGQWNLAVTSAEEGARLAEETGEPLWYAGARIGHGFVAVLRGDYDLAQSHVAEAERIALPYRARPLLASLIFVRGLSALGTGRHGAAYEQLRRLFDPADPAFHAMERFFAVGDLAEAAAHSGNEHDARALVEELEDVARHTPAVRVHMTLRHARAVLARAGEAEALYQAGLDADLGRWPFDRARLLLAYGSWLRRRRRVAESRAPLRAARETFDALGAAPWSERASQELRASGETSRRRAPEAWAELSPQELQIAKMAAEGLTNREIGQKLYLSHRTVGSHLYHLFPKLGVTSRAQLATAMQSLD